MRRLLWKVQDLIDAALNWLNEARRWRIIDFLMYHKIIMCCRVDGYFWAARIQDGSIFDLGTCTNCAGSSYCYCGKERL
jgi:hypothetical protein